MFHQVARTRRRALLFGTWSEARVLWVKIAERVPGISALCLMPDHVHLLTVGDSRRELGHALSAYVRWHNARNGLSGRLLAPSPDAVRIDDPLKIRRTERYIHLNPCRAGLCGDPLEWPFSTYRDAVGLTADPVRRPDPDPARTHAYTSADPSVRVQGTLLPAAMASPPTADAVFDAVGALSRRVAIDLKVRGPARTLFVRAARVLTAASCSEVAALAAVTPRAVERVEIQHDLYTRRVERVVGDSRFAALWPGELRMLHGWGRYRRSA
ncbi:MAG: hypothetical protein R3F61_27935 [Myxococcota bacterium]